MNGRLHCLLFQIICFQNNTDTSLKKKERYKNLYHETFQIFYNDDLSLLSYETFFVN